MLLLLMQPRAWFVRELEHSKASMRWQEPCICMYVCMYTHVYAYIQTKTHTDIHTQTHTLSFSHTHIHTQIVMQPRVLFAFAPDLELKASYTSS